MAGRLSTRKFRDNKLFLHNRHTDRDSIGLVDKTDEKNEEINANYITLEASPELGTEDTETEQEMAQEDGTFQNESAEKSRCPKVDLSEAEWNGNDRNDTDVDTVDDDSSSGRRRATTRDVQKTASPTKYVRFEKGAKNEDGCRSHKKRRNNIEKIDVESDDKSAPRTCGRVWKRVRKFVGKQLGRFFSLIGKGALVSSPIPGSYVRVQPRQSDRWSQNQNPSPSYGMLLF